MASSSQSVAINYGRAGLNLASGMTETLAADTCGTYIIGLRDAALISLAYDAGLRVSELVGTTVADLRQVSDGSGRLEIAHSKTDQVGEGALAWLAPDTMARLSAWLLASGITQGAVCRRINVLTSPPDAAGQQTQRHYIGKKPLTRQGVVTILRRRVLEAVDLGLVELEPGTESDTARGLKRALVPSRVDTGPVCSGRGRRWDRTGAALVLADHRAALCPRACRRR